MIQSLYDQFYEVVKKCPKNIAIRFEKKKWTYAQTNKLILDCEKKLASLGVQKGDVLTVALPNCPYSVFLFYAINKRGAISYNIHPLTPNDTIEEMMNFVSSKTLICLSLNAKEAAKTLGKEKRIIALNPYLGASPFKKAFVSLKSKKAMGIIDFGKIKKAKKIQKVTIDKEEDAVYLNTGGTSGAPKVVRMSNRAINHVGANSYQLIGGPYESIRILTAIPLFHIFGLEMGVHTPLSFGGQSVLMLRFHTKEAINHMKSGRSTVLLGVPSLYNALLSRDSFYGKHLKKQVTAFIGGDTVPESLLDRWNKAMVKYGSDARLYEGYGLTEAGVAIVSTKGRSKKGSIGMPLPGIHVKILDIETHKEVEHGKLGEIAIGGPSLMSGYYKDDKLNQEDLIDIDGVRYFLTKDYGYCDKDGFGYFKQRMRRIVKINGETLCPSDVEDAVLTLDDVFDAYCYGVPNKRKGAAFRLIVVKRDGDHPKSEEQVRALINEKINAVLPPSYLPEKIFFVSRLPRTAIGKIDAKEIEKNPQYFN